MILPVYTLLLGPDRAAGLHGHRGRASTPARTPNYGRCRCCSQIYFPSWFLGVAFAAIAIGALVPAAIMSIAAANLFTRNIYKAFLQPRRHRRAADARSPKLTSLVVKAGAVAFIVLAADRVRHRVAAAGRRLDPADHARRSCSGLYTRWLHAWALVAGWAAGMTCRHSHGRIARDLKSSVYELNLFGATITAYEGVFALVLNLVIAVGLTLVLSALGHPPRRRRDGGRRLRGAGRAHGGGHTRMATWDSS